MKSFTIGELLSTKQETTSKSSNFPVAIIGMSSRLPGCRHYEDFWKILVDGKCMITDLSSDRIQDCIKLSSVHSKGGERNFTKAAYIDRVDTFDSGFFGISPNEASLMNPNQRIFLETVWNAIEDSGYSPQQIYSTDTGVFVGYIGDADGAKYAEFIKHQNVDKSLQEISIAGNIASMIASRISFYLNLKGPTALIDTACSSSAVAIHTAVNSLASGDCSLAIVGGINVMLAPLDDNLRIGIESPSNMVRAFDENADGTALGEGVIAVVLKPLQRAIDENDNIHAVIKGCAVNQDGFCSAITAPNVNAQEELLVNTWKKAGINPQDLTYIEAHGTGTHLGDPIEFEALNRAISKFTKKKQFCGIGSVKGNIGHLYAAAGLAGLLKGILCLKNKMLVPNPNFSMPNTNIDFINSALYNVDRCSTWDAEKRNAIIGVSAFGISGTNCHVVLEEAPDRYHQQRAERLRVLTVSAEDLTVLRSLLSRYSLMLQNASKDEFPDICYTSNIGRLHLRYRVAVIASSIDELRSKLDKLTVPTISGVANGVFYGDCGNVLPSSAVRKARRTINPIKNGGDVEPIESTTNLEEPDWQIVSNLCQEYVLGKDSDWAVVHKGETCKRISLPIYPFARNRCWPTSVVGASGNTDLNRFCLGYRWKQVDYQHRDVDSEQRVAVITGNGTDSKRIIRSIESLYHSILIIEHSSIGVTNKTGIVGNQPSDSIRDLARKLSTERITHIVYLQEFSGKLIEQNCQEQLAEVERFFCLTKALCEDESNRFLTLVTFNSIRTGVSDTENVDPFIKIIAGVGRVLSRESNIQFREIDCDQSTDNNLIAREIFGGGGGLQTVFREGRRLVRQIHFANWWEYQADVRSIRAGATYVITGGFGDIGLETAKLIARNAKVNIVLISRNVPLRDEWQTILKKNPQGELAEKIKAFKHIEDLGSRVITARCNVCDRAETIRVFESIRKEIGDIRGVFHYAGIARIKKLVEENWLDFKTVLGPKVLGALNLSAATDRDPIDFFVMASSISTFFYSSGLSAYVGANCFLDGLIEQRTMQRLPATCINWSAWKSLGMAARHNDLDDNIFRRLETGTAVDLMNRIINSSMQQVIIGEFNEKSSMIRWLENYPYMYSEEILNIIEASKTKTNSSQLPERGLVDEVELALINICKRILGYDEIAPDANLIDLGADSIILTKIFDAIILLYPDSLSIPELLKNPTITAASRIIHSKREITSTDLTASDRSANRNQQEARTVITNIDEAMRFLTSEGMS